MNSLVIDAGGAALGRLASFVAKQALLGKEVSVVNCENAIVMGSPRSVIIEFKENRARGGASMHGPFYPKHPDKLVKRVVRGMLPFKNPRGKQAYKKVKCYLGVPEKFAGANKVTMVKKQRARSIKVLELSKEL